MAYRYNIDFSDAERALIEAYRMKRGHKATATAVRELIAAGLMKAGADDGNTRAALPVGLYHVDALGHVTLAQSGDKP